MSGHTEERWEACGCLISADGEWIAMVRKFPFEPEKERRIVQQIAASPDLLAALRLAAAALESIESRGDCPLCLHGRGRHSADCAVPESIQTARAAIAKATGGQA